MSKTTTPTHMKTNVDLFFSLALNINESEKTKDNLYPFMCLHDDDPYEQWYADELKKSEWMLPLVFNASDESDEVNAMRAKFSYYMTRLWFAMADKRKSDTEWVKRAVYSAYTFLEKWKYDTFIETLTGKGIAISDVRTDVLLHGDIADHIWDLEFYIGDQLMRVDIDISACMYDIADDMQEYDMDDDKDKLLFLSNKFLIEEYRIASTCGDVDSYIMYPGYVKNLRTGTIWEWEKFLDFLALGSIPKKEARKSLGMK